MIGLLGACLWVLAPFWSALFWAAVLAFASWPLMRGLTRLLGGRPATAAGLLTLGWMLLVAVPLVWLGFNLADHLRQALALFKDMQVAGLPPAPEWMAGLPLVGPSLVGPGRRSTSRAARCWPHQALPGRGRQLAAGAQRAGSAAGCWSWP